MQGEEKKNINGDEFAGQEKERKTEAEVDGQIDRLGEAIIERRDE